MEFARTCSVGAVVAFVGVAAGREVAARTTVRVSADSAGAQGNGLSVGPSISADGRHVGFVSAANHLVLGGTTGI
jgi:hypothetical protein